MHPIGSSVDDMWQIEVIVRMDEVAFRIGSPSFIYYSFILENYIQGELTNKPKDSNLPRKPTYQKRQK